MTQMREQCNLVFSGKAEPLASKLHLQVQLPCYGRLGAHTLSRSLAIVRTHVCGS